MTRREFMNMTSKQFNSLANGDLKMRRNQHDQGKCKFGRQRVLNSIALVFQSLTFMLNFTVHQFPIPSSESGTKQLVAT